jgi:hypothetical protein
MLAGMPTQLRHLAAAVAALEAATSDQYLDVNGAVDVSAIMNAFGSNRPGLNAAKSSLQLLYDALPAERPEHWPRPPLTEDAASSEQIHPSAFVLTAVDLFEQNESKHRVDTCYVCNETRPVFTSSQLEDRARRPGEAKTVKLNPWTVRLAPAENESDGSDGSDEEEDSNDGLKQREKKRVAGSVADVRACAKRGICTRCRDSRRQRKRAASGVASAVEASPYSGWRTVAARDLGPGSTALRHNDQHFLPVPPFLQHLTAVEVALVCRISCIQRIFILRGGMLGSRGHCVSVPANMKVASKRMPLLPSEVDIVVLKRRNAKGQLRAYTVQRSKVEMALRGLCDGQGGGPTELQVLRALAEELHLPQRLPLSELREAVDKLVGPVRQYDGPRQSAKGLWFAASRAPNRFYADVVIDAGRLSALPLARSVPDSLRTIHVDDMPEEEDLGPAPAQHKMPGTSATDPNAALNRLLGVQRLDDADGAVDRGEGPEPDDALQASTHQGGEVCADDVLEEGAAVLYEDQPSGKTVRVRVCKVHHDHTPPSYSIRLPSGHERHTLRERLEREPLDTSTDVSNNDATSCAAAATETPMDESTDKGKAGLGGGNGFSTRGVFPVGSELSTHPLDLPPTEYEALAARERAVAPELDEQPSIECYQWLNDVLTKARAEDMRKGLKDPSVGAWSYRRRAQVQQRRRGLTDTFSPHKPAEEEPCKQPKLPPMIAPEEDDISSYSSDECSHDAVSRDGTNGGDESDRSNDGEEELPRRFRPLTILGGTLNPPNLSVTPSDKGVDDEDSEPAGPDLTYSGIACPRDPRDLEQEVRQALEQMLGAGNADAVRTALSSGRVAVTEWEREEGEAVKELATEGFFAMVAPHVFVNGSCDITIPQLVRLSLHEWIRHIYWTGDGRVPRHRNLKFILFNLMLRKRALEQGGFLVAQQLDDAHLGIEALRAAHESGDDSVARKIISVGGNLINTDTYWRERKRELDAMHSWRRARYGDLPAYFQTNSIAEYHDPHLHRVLALYLSRTRGDIDERAGSFETALHHLQTDNSYLRDVLQECGHITTTYFDAHATNYYATVLKEVMQYDDAWWRYEFAKSRGAIHSHGLTSSRMHRAMTEAAQRCGWSDWAAESARLPPEEDDGDEDAADEARRDAAAQHLACFLCDETAYAPEAEDARDLGAIVNEAKRPQPHADLNLSATSLRCRLTEQDGVPVGPGFVSLHPAGTITPGVPNTCRWAPPEGSEPEAGQPGGPPSHLLRNRLRHALAEGSAGVPDFHRNLCNRLLLHGCSSGYCLSRKRDKASKQKCAAAPLAPAREPHATAGG